MSEGRSVRIIGPGRAGGALMAALGAVGWQVTEPLGRHDDVTSALGDVDLLVLAVPDEAIASVARSVTPVRGGGVIAHLAGASGLDVLAPHHRTAAVHPLVSLPSVTIGAERLRHGPWFAVAGDPVAHRVVADLGGQAVEVADGDRAAYHAAATMASNHIVALLGQVERVAAGIGVPAEAYVALAAGSLANVETLGAAAALTGPVARGDWATVARHIDAIDPSEHAAYRALAAAARRLVNGEGLPPDL